MSQARKLLLIVFHTVIFVTYFVLELIVFKRDINYILICLFIIWILASLFICLFISRKQYGKDDERALDKVLQGNFEDLGSLKKSKNMLFSKLVKFLDYFKNTLGNMSLEISKIKKALKIVEINFLEDREGIRQISNATEDIAKGSTSQARDAEKTLAIAMELQNKIETLSKSSQMLSIRTSSLEDVSVAGKKNVKDLLESDRETQDLVSDITDKIDELNKKAKDINQITSAISSIAGQTNLLSLNASIEAARAGTAGIGFAVVAGEIKKLADLSQAASSKISNIVAYIQKEINTIIQTSEKTREHFIIRKDSINSVSITFSDIGDALKDMINKQIEVYDEIESLHDFKNKVIDSISDIAAIAEESAASTQEVASLVMYQTNQQESSTNSIAKLKDSVKNLDELMGEFNIFRVQEKRVKIGISLLEQSEFMGVILDEAQKEAEKLDVELIYKTPKKVNVEEQIRFINEFIEENVDGIALFPSDPDKLAPVIDKAVNKGIPVICIDNDSPKSKRLSIICTDYMLLGKEAGLSAAKHLKGKGKIIALLCASGVPTVQLRFAGFKDSLRGYNDIEILEKMEMLETDLDETRKNIVEIMRKNPDFDLLYVVTDDSSMISARIFKEMRIDKKLVCIANSTEVMKFVKEGVVSSQYCMRNGLWGSLAVHRLTDAIEGKSIPKFEDTGAYEVNKNNVIIFSK